MSSTDAKTQFDRLFNKKQSTSSVGVGVAAETHPKKGMFRRLQTEANLLKRNVVQSTSNPSPSSDSSRDVLNGTSTNSSASPSSNSHAATAGLKRRSDRNSANDDLVIGQGCSQPSSPGASISKTSQLQVKLVRIIEENRPTVQQLNRIAGTFQSLLDDKCGLELFREFLRTEFCQENIDFWCACESYRNSNELNVAILKQRAKQLYDEFVCEDASRQVNLDSDTRKQTAAIIDAPGINTAAFELAQQRVQTLMEKDKYQRFLQSDVYRYALEAAQKANLRDTPLRS